VSTSNNNNCSRPVNYNRTGGDVVWLWVRVFVGESTLAQVQRC
jgi:hypothetical protein